MIARLSLLLCALGVGPASPSSEPPAAASSSEAAAEAIRVHLRVDAKALGEEGIGMDGMLVEALGPKLEAAGFTLVEGPGDDVISLQIRLRVVRKSEYDHGVHFEFVEGEAVEPAIEWRMCLICGDFRLLELLEASSEELIEAIRKRASEGPEAPAGGTPEVQPPPPRPLGPMGGVGIGVAALGLGSTIAGAVLLARGRVFDELDDLNKTGTDYRPYGTAFLAAGVAAVVTGGALLTADLIIRKNKRKNQRLSSQAFYPMLSIDTFGLGYTARF